MCARCGHAEDVHARYVRNLTCCYDCSCFGFQPPSDAADEPGHGNATVAVA